MTNGKFDKGLRHPIYKEYLKEVERVAPFVLFLFIKFNIDESEIFNHRLYEINEAHTKIILDFSDELINEEVYRHSLLSLIPKIAALYQDCIQSIPKEELDDFFSKVKPWETTQQNGE